MFVGVSSFGRVLIGNYVEGRDPRREGTFIVRQQGIKALHTKIKASRLGQGTKALHSADSARTLVGTIFQPMNACGREQCGQTQPASNTSPSLLSVLSSFSPLPLQIPASWASSTFICFSSDPPAALYSFDSPHSLCETPFASDLVPALITAAHIRRRPSHTSSSPSANRDILAVLISTWQNSCAHKYSAQLSKSPAGTIVYPADDLVTLPPPLRIASLTAPQVHGSAACWNGCFWARLVWQTPCDAGISGVG